MGCRLKGGFPWGNGRHGLSLRSPAGTKKRSYPSHALTTRNQTGVLGRLGVTMRFVSTLLGLVIGDLLGRLLFIPFGWPFDIRVFANRIGVLTVLAFVICFVWEYVRDRFGWLGSGFDQKDQG